MELRRGDLVIVSAPGSYGKPRPGVVVQSDLFPDTGSLTVVLMSSTLRTGAELVRQTVLPSESNGLRVPTDLMIDKLFTIPRERMGKRIGRLTGAEMTRLSASLSVFLGI